MSPTATCLRHSLGRQLYYNHLLHYPPGRWERGGKKSNPTLDVFVLFLRIRRNADQATQASLKTRLKMEPVRRPEALRQPLWPIWILDHSSGLPAGGPQQIFGSAFLEWHPQLAAAATAAMPRPVSALSPLALTTHAHKGIAFPSLRHCSKRAYIMSGLNCEPDDRDRERGHRGVRRGRTRARAAALGAWEIPPHGRRVHN